MQKNVAQIMVKLIFKNFCLFSFVRVFFRISITVHLIEMTI